MSGDAAKFHTRMRARARTEVSRTPTVHELPPPPSFKQNSRERSSSIGTTFVSTAVVPAPDSTEILSSLISSLSVLSDSTRDQPQPRPAAGSEPLLHESATTFLQPDSSDSDQDSPPPPRSIRDSGDDDVAEAPVVGYARGAPKPGKKSVKERWAIHRAGRNASVNSLGGKSVNTKLQPQGAQSGFGIPSIERPPSSAANSVRMNGSRSSLDHAMRAPLRILFAAKSGEVDAAPAPSVRVHHEDDRRSTRTTRSKTSARYVKPNREPDRTPEIQPILLPDDVPPLQKSVSETPSSRAYNPLDPGHREDLGEHLIPSRRSSVRHSPAKASIIRPSSAKASTPGRDVQTVPVDGEIMEEEDDDDPTIRRIKELRRAREKRQHDMDLERASAHSTRNKKRLSLSEKTILAGPTVRSISPVKGGLYGVSGAEPDVKPPAFSATINGPDLGTIPVFVEGEASPLPSPLTPRTPTPRTPTSNIPRSSPAMNGRVHGAPPSPLKHKRVFSGSLRRSGSMRRNGPSDIKAITEEIEAFVSAPRLAQRVRHPRTGRTITFSEVGDFEGSVVLVCPGMGLTKYVTAFYDDVAKAQKLRLLTLDRPGIGDSDALPDTVNPPLAWADDVMVICQALSIQTFSLVAHSAGAIYALAIALKMPNYVRGKIHLLSPYVPQSQMAPKGESEVKTANLPTTQRILSKLPASLLKVANNRLLSAKSTGVDTKLARKKEKELASSYEAMMADLESNYRRPLPTPDPMPRRGSTRLSHESSNATRVASPPVSPSPTPGSLPRPSMSGLRSRMVSPAPVEQLTPQARQAIYDRQLASRIWELATTNANPGTELIVCLESRRWIGFYYRDVTRGIVIHHGRLDKIVPVQNAQWLQRILLKSEIRILDKEDHHLMGNARVISNVLAEVASECEELDIIARATEKKRREIEAAMIAKVKLERERFIRTGQY